MEHVNSIHEEDRYLHSYMHNGCLGEYKTIIDQRLYIDHEELAPIQTKRTVVKKLYKAMSDKLFLLEAVLFLMYLSLLWISVLSLSYVPSLIVLIRILRVVLVISECCLFLQERRVRKRLHLLEREDSLLL